MFFFFSILYFFNRFRWGSRHRSSGGGVMCRERDGRNKFENNNIRETILIRCMYSNRQWPSGGGGAALNSRKTWMGGEGRRGGGWKKIESSKLIYRRRYTYTHIIIIIIIIILYR